MRPINMLEGLILEAGSLGFRLSFSKRGISATLPRLPVCWRHAPSFGGVLVVNPTGCFEIYILFYRLFRNPQFGRVVEVNS